MKFVQFHKSNVLVNGRLIDWSNTHSISDQCSRLIDWLIWFDFAKFNRHISSSQRPLWNVPCTNLDGEIASDWKGLKHNSATDSTAPARDSSRHRSHEFHASLLPAPTKSKENKFKLKFKSAKKKDAYKKDPFLRFYHLPIPNQPWNGRQPPPLPQSSSPALARKLWRRWSSWPADPWPGQRVARFSGIQVTQKESAGHQWRPKSPHRRRSPVFVAWKKGAATKAAPWLLTKTDDVPHYMTVMVMVMGIKYPAAPYPWRVKNNCRI